MRNDPRIHRHSDLTTLDACGAATMLTVQLATSLASKRIRLRNLRLVRKAGTGANFQARVFESSTGADEDETQAARFANLAVAQQCSLANLEKPAVGQEVIVKLDADARFYLRPTPDAGADNTFAYVVEYDVIDPNMADTTA